MQKRKEYLIRKNLHEKVNKPKPNIISDIATGASREVTEFWNDPYMDPNLDRQQQIRQSSLFGTAIEQAGYATGATNYFMNPDADVAKEAAWRLQNRPGLVLGEAAVWGLTIPIRGVSIGGKILAKTLQKTGTKGAKVGKAIEKANVKSAAKWATKPTTKHLGRRR